MYQIILVRKHNLDGNDNQHRTKSFYTNCRNRAINSVHRWCAKNSSSRPAQNNGNDYQYGASIYRDALFWFAINYDGTIDQPFIE